MNNHSPPVHGGIHMVEEDGRFEIAVSLRNPTGDPVSLRTMDGGLFHVRMRERTFTEEGERHLWSPSLGYTQAVTHWRLTPLSVVTEQYTVPNKQDAIEKVESFADEFGDFMDFDDPEEEIGSVDFPYVVPEDVGVVQVVASLPSGNDYFSKLTRQFDLRSNPSRVLDDELPPETRQGINRI